MADKRIIDLDAASSYTGLLQEVSGTDGISKKAPYTDPATIVNSVTGTGVDNTDPNNPVVNARVVSVISGTDITVDNSNPTTPIINFTGTVPLPYLVYSVILSFNGATFSIKPLQNTIGDGSGDGVNDIAWTSNGAGIITATQSNAPFTLDKTTAYALAYTNSNYPVFVIPRVDAASADTTHIPFHLIAYSGGLVASVLDCIPVEIRVYP